MYQFQYIDQIIQCKKKFLDSMRYTVYEKSTPREVKAFTILIYWEIRTSNHQLKKAAVKGNIEHLQNEKSGLHHK